MSSKFDAPSITRGEGDQRWASFVSVQPLTEDQKTTLRGNLGINGAGETVYDVDPDGTPVLVVGGVGVQVDTDPDGTPVLVIGADVFTNGYDGGVEY